MDRGRTEHVLEGNAELCQELPGRSRLRAGGRLNEAIELVRKNVDLELILEKAEDR